jgi:hypothetical protein
MIILSTVSRGIMAAAGSSGGGGGATKLLTISGSDDATHIKWDMNATYEGSWAFPNAAEGFAYTNPVSNMLCNSPNAGRMFFVARTNDGPGTEAMRFCEASVPTPYIGTNQSLLVNATVTDPLINIRTGAPVDDGAWGANGARINGINVINGKVMFACIGAYANDYPTPGGNQYSYMVMDNAANISGSNTKHGFYRSLDVDTDELLNARVAGWITELPDSLKATFGGTHICGDSSGNNRSLNSRHSIGPSFYVYDANASDAPTGNTPPASGSDIYFKCLANYPLGPDSLTPESLLNSPGQTWTNLSEAFIGFILEGTWTYVVFGLSGGHAGPSNPSVGYSGGFYPINSSDFGGHYWLFDYRQHLEVLAGTRQPHEVECYEHGQIIGRWTTAGGNAWTGGYYDTAAKRLFLVTAQRDAGNYASAVEQYNLSGVAS